MSPEEEIAKKYGLCNCDEAYTKRGLTAPDCPLHGFALEECLEAYGKEMYNKAIEDCIKNCEPNPTWDREALESLKLK